MTLDLPSRLLMGPGPSEAYPQALSALGQPPIGHMDPAFIKVMDRLATGLKTLFGTENPLTFAASGTGSAGMEMLLSNLIEPGDKVLIFRAGVFGRRMTDLAERLGATIVTVDTEWGTAFSQEEMIAAVDAHEPALVCLVHAETSTGVRQDVDLLGPHVRQKGGLLVLDCVTSLGGMPVEIDKWCVDAAFSGSQKCLSTPPGLAPVTFNQRAIDKRMRRRAKPPTWYLDIEMLMNYWGGDRAYHHTAPTNMVFALTAAVETILAEGLQACFARHQTMHKQLAAALAARGFNYLPASAVCLPMLNAVTLPETLDDSARKRLLSEHGIEVGGGLGALAGRVWRIGLMGHTAQSESIARLMTAIDAL